jgi:CspA family cold shock protein
MNNEVYFGTVIFFDNKLGFGFLEWFNKDGNKNKDIFFHFSAINCEGFKTIKKDQKVSFELGKNNSDQLVAIDVTAVNA